HVWDLTGFWGWVAFAAIAAIVCFPAVYRRTIDRESPLFLQFVSIFTAGLGWQALFGTAVAAVSPH
ncbi:MAG TPA: hypothetical protein VM389_08660, partial [Phycisphaerae bacterium]|nr:hypothetical protein [Phycisphaerae bacterium]